MSIIHDELNKLDTPVGMVLYHDEDSLDAYIFSEILLDAQLGKGYGTTATKLVLDRMKDEIIMELDLIS